MLISLRRRALWIGAILCGLLISASLDNIPDPPATASACAGRHALRIHPDHRVQPPAVLRVAVTHCLRTMFRLLPWSEPSGMFPICTPAFTALPHAADSSPPLLFA